MGTAGTAAEGASWTETKIRTFWNDDLKEAWQRLVKDGRYRMAQPTDFRFSELARNEIGESQFRAFTHWPVIDWWGGTGVIVVDTTRSDDNRFGLIVFMEPENYFSPKKKGPCPYKAAWLYRNRDLSRTTLEQASGYWFVVRYDDSGNRVARDEQRFGRLTRITANNVSR
jgi:hypothetical protein